MKTTVRIKASQINKDWHVLDAAGVPLGRLATRAATLLRGKHKPTFEPHLDGGDFVIIVNADKVSVSGNKATAKLYYRHSGYPGGLRSRTFEQELERFPDRVVRQAIWGMLPKGPLGKALLRHLKVYAGPDHPHQSQVVGSERARADRDDAIPWVPTRLSRSDSEVGAPEPDDAPPEFEAFADDQAGAVQDEMAADAELAGEEPEAEETAEDASDDSGDDDAAVDNPDEAKE